jgi:2-amino-4-hydroxy-6-hydroxymethyldihydropteridine diphosphokinase
MARAYVGFGSNLDNPAEQIRAALAAVADMPGTTLLSASSLYSSSPMGPQDQPDYINAVAELETVFTPQQLLAELLRIEREAGRNRENALHWGPRVLDLDLLVYADQQISEPYLTVPHPGIAERSFVVLPLFEIAPDLQIPGVATVRSLAQSIDSAGLRRLPAVE